MGYSGDNSTHYFIPGIGIYNLDIEKAKPVKILYDFLDEVGEIDRLKNLDHLGIVREVIDGARHSRFDYIALIFALIDNWDQKVDEIHAFSSVKFKLEVGEKEVKGKDLIKCWALLFNIGHLEWTFFTERILLEVLFQEKLHTKLIENIDKEEIKKRAKEIFKFCDYSHFYQILAYLRFDCLYKQNKDKINKEDKIWFEEVYKQMFKKYIVDDFSDKVEESNLPYLKSLYRTVRNIAFLLLDSFYTPSGLNLSPVLILDNPELIRSIVFGETEISNTLKFLNRQLYKSVYLNEKVLAIQSLYYEDLKKKLKKRIEDLKNGIDICNCDFVNKIYDELIKDVIKEVKKDVKSKSKHIPIMRFEFEGDDLNKQLKEELYKPQLVEINSNLNFYKVVWKTPLNFYVIQYNSNADKQSSIATLKESFDMVKKFLISIKDKDNGAGYIEHKRDVIEKIAKKYVSQALKIFFNSEDIRWEWKHTSFLRSYFNFPDAVMGFTDDVYGFYKENITSKFDEKRNETSESYRGKMKSIKKELEAKLEVVKILKDGEESIKGKPDILCITISNLIAYSVHSGNQLMEVDGLILGLTTEKQLFICLIEAKSSNEKAVKNLKSKICARIQDILEVYDISKISNLINSVKGLKDNEKDLSIAYLIITDEKNPNSF
ncbi:MAG: hypothetical protein LM570_04545 [Thermocrinis sp.]|nr:hypothetical protein [Thermocrinis sp.]